MASSKTYVHVARFGVKDAFDSKYASKLPKLMKTCVERAINGSSKLTTKKPRDRKAPGFYVDGSLVKLERIGSGAKTTIRASLRLALATWPKKSMFAFPSGSAKLTIGETKRLEAEIEYLVGQMLDALLQSKVVKVLEKRSK